MTDNSYNYIRKGYGQFVAPDDNIKIKFLLKDDESNILGSSDDFNSLYFRVDKDLQKTQLGSLLLKLREGDIIVSEGTWIPEIEKSRSYLKYNPDLTSYDFIDFDTTLHYDSDYEESIIDAYISHYNCPRPYVTAHGYKENNMKTTVARYHDKRINDLEEEAEDKYVSKCHLVNCKNGKYHVSTPSCVVDPFDSSSTIRNSIERLSTYQISDQGYDYDTDRYWTFRSQEISRRQANVISTSICHTTFASGWSRLVNVTDAVSRYGLMGLFSSPLSNSSIPSPLPDKWGYIYGDISSPHPHSTHRRDIHSDLQSLLPSPDKLQSLDKSSLSSISPSILPSTISSPIRSSDLSFVTVSSSNLDVSSHVLHLEQLHQFSSSSAPSVHLYLEVISTSDAKYVEENKNLTKSILYDPYLSINRYVSHFCNTNNLTFSDSDLDTRDIVVNPMFKSYDTMLTFICANYNLQTIFSSITDDTEISTEKSTGISAPFQFSLQLNTDISDVHVESNCLSNRIVDVGNRRNPDSTFIRPGWRSSCLVDYSISTPPLTSDHDGVGHLLSFSPSLLSNSRKSSELIVSESNSPLSYSPNSISDNKLNKINHSHDFSGSNVNIPFLPYLCSDPVCINSSHFCCSTPVITLDHSSAHPTSILKYIEFTTKIFDCLLNSLNESPVFDDFPFQDIANLHQKVFKDFTEDPDNINSFTNQQIVISFKTLGLVLPSSTLISFLNLVNSLPPLPLPYAVEKALQEMSVGQTVRFEVSEEYSYGPLYIPVFQLLNQSLYITLIPPNCNLMIDLSLHSFTRPLVSWEEVHDKKTVYFKELYNLANSIFRVGRQWVSRALLLYLSALVWTNQATYFNADLVTLDLKEMSELRSLCYTQISICEGLLGLPEKSRETISEALKLNPCNPFALYRMAQYTLHDGNTSVSSDYCKKALLHCDPNETKGIYEKIIKLLRQISLIDEENNSNLKLSMKNAFKK